MTRTITAPEPAAGHPQRWKILAVLCSALCIVVLDNTILTVALPRIKAELGAGESQLQWIVATYGLIIAALLLPLAGIGDRFGRRKLLLVGALVFGLTSALAAFARTPGELIIARGLMGLGGAATMPATLAVLSNIFPPHERPRAIGIWSAVAGVAAAAGPVTGGILLTHFWWGSVFLVNVPVCALVFLFARRLVPESSDPATPPLDLAGSVLWSVALGLLLLAFIFVGEHGWLDVAVIGPMVVGAVLLLAFAAWERRCPHPLLSPAAMSVPRMQAGIVVIPAVFFTVFGLQFVFTQWLQEVRALGPLAAGAVFVPHSVAVLCASLLFPRVAGRLGLGRAAALGMGLMGIAVLLGLALPIGLGVIVALVTVLGLGMGTAAPAGTELIMGSVPPEHAGQAAGMNETIVEAGGALGVAVLGSVLTVAAGGADAVSHDALTGPGADAARDAFTNAIGAPLIAALVVLGAAVLITIVRDKDRPPSRRSGRSGRMGRAPRVDRISGAADPRPGEAPTTGS